MVNTIQTIMMTEPEAKELVAEIKADVHALGEKLLELHDREGWKALGYDSWRACVMAEFDFSQSRVYQLLSHARVVKNITADSTIVEKPTREGQTRPLAGLPPARQREAWQQATKEQPQPTGQQVQRVVADFRPVPKEAQLRGKGTKTGVSVSSQVPRSDTDGPDPYKMRQHLEGLGYLVIGPDETGNDVCPVCGRETY